MTDLPAPTFTQLSILDGHRLLSLAAYDLGEDDKQSALYEHELDAKDAEAVEPLLDANTWLTAALPTTDSPLVFGSLDGEVVFAGDDDVEAVEASNASVTALLTVGEAVVATTALGEVVAIHDDQIDVWKEEGPVLLSAALHEGALWIAGEQGYLARRQGDAWVKLETGTEVALHALVSGPAGLLAVGEHGTVVRVSGDKAAVQSVGGAQLSGAAVWGDKVVLAAGDAGLLELTDDGTRALRTDACEAVAADDQYLVFASKGAVFTTKDGQIWTELAYAAPEPAGDFEHEHDENCDHEH